MEAMPMTDRPAPDSDSAPTIWLLLRSHLAERFGQLNSEIRHYPTPIARCDDQLPKLIEQRDHARGELERMREVDAASAGSDAPGLRQMEGFLEGATPTDDETELDLRSRLETAVLAAKG
jgi:hypothetical protein